MGAKAAKKEKIPHVWHVREYGDSDFRLQFIKGRKKSTMFMNQVSGKIVFISKSLREHYNPEIYEKNCEVIYNGLPKEYMRVKERTGNDDGKISFLISGNLHRNKRQELAIDACKILEEKGYSNFELIIAGGAASLKDSRDYESELKSSAKKIKKGHVIFAGFVSDMNLLRAKADVELVCSSSEAFGRVTIEAMMASDPVIASDSGASPELIEEGKNGWLFRAGDAYALAECMEKSIANRKKVIEMGEYAYLFARKKFTSESNTENIEKVYRKIFL